jgi:two-component system sensor histidine kinase TctE
MSSIRVRLLKWLVGPILLINLAAAGLTYLLAWTPAQLAFDQGLTDALASLAAQLRQGAAPAALAPGPAARADGDTNYFTIRSPDGAWIAGEREFPAIGAAGAAGIDDAVLHGMPVRVATQTVEGGGRRYQLGVARTTRQRQQIRGAIVRSLVLLEGLVTLALVGLAWLSVTNGLLPLARMRSSLDARDGADLAPIGQEAVPYELTPVVSAFNDLLTRVQHGARAQQDFIADVAHQLRTPLAGLKLQLEWLAERHARDQETARSLQLMRVANDRMIRQTNQLLALARATPAATGKARRERLDLAALVQESIQYFVGEAAKKGLDLGFELAPAPVMGDAFSLRDLIDNLVDNAVRYTPAGGTVTVRCGTQGSETWFAVDDSGPGIPLAKRTLVFNRFVRLDEKTPGSGLGLAIVRDIALAHRAHIELADLPDAAGMRIALRFPGIPAHSV